MDNLLSPGLGGLPAPSTKDEMATPPGGTPPTPQGAGVGLQPPGPTHMQRHFMSAEDKAALRFSQVKKAAVQMQALQDGLDKLGALGDTVSFDDVVDVAAGIVAAGVPAIQVAGTLANMPESPSQLQAWIAKQAAALAPQVKKVQGTLAAARYEMGRAAFRSIIAHSAADHLTRLASKAKTTGRPN